MLVPHGSGPTRALEVSRPAIRSLSAITVTAVLAALILIVAAIARGVSITRASLLENENHALVDQVRSVRERLAVLSDSLDTLAQYLQEGRLLAGLEPLDPAVLQAGIGGPPGEWPERDSLEALGPNGAQAVSARLNVEGLMRRAEILTRSANQAYDSLSSHISRYAATPSIMPVPGWISSPFAAARLDPILQIVRPHEGIDIAAPPGTPIMASAAGVVAKVGWEAEGYGNFLLIEHGYGVVTRYAHCSRILVTPGQRVTRGQVIALVGSTGEATGPHVHYEVIVYGKPVDPMRYIQPANAIAD
jgi:hypothetical protein